MKSKKNRFFPLFITQCLNAFNDNAFKNSLILIITYESLSAYGLNTKEIISVATFLFTLPYLMFSSYAGNLTDRTSKDKLARTIKFLEIFIMALSIYAIPSRNVTLFIVLLFFMGMQSTFFSPVKLSMLPELVSEKNLLKANGIFSMGTFFSILFGTAVGGILVKSFSDNSAYIGVALTFFSILGYLSSLRIPHLKAQNTKTNTDNSILTCLKNAFSNNTIKYAVIFSSWLWFAGIYYLSTLPLIIKNYFFMDETISTLYMAVFSIGIAIGSLVSSKVSKNFSISKCIFTGILGMTLFHIIGSSLIQKPDIIQNSYGGIEAFLNNQKAIFLLITISIVSIFGGMFIVPLQTLVQLTADPKECARMISALNIFQAIALLSSSALLFILYRIGLDTHEHYYVLIILYLLVCITILPKLKYLNHQK